MVIIENKGIEEIMQEISGLSEYNALFDDLEQSALFNPETSMCINNHDFFQNRTLVSEIMEKRGINDRLGNLAFHINSLRNAASENNNEQIKNRINLILNNEYSSIKTVISELDSLKSKIDEFEKLHIDLLNNNLLSLDIKMLLEQDFRKKQKLNELFDKQKGILIRLSKTFVKIGKEL